MHQNKGAAMVRYVMLLKFTPEGMVSIKESPERKESFEAAVLRCGGQVEAGFWTLGDYDGVAIFTAPDEATATTLALDLGRSGYVRTCLLRAFDVTEFKHILDRVL